MDEQAVALLRQILDELKKVNERLDIITENGSHYSIWDVCNKVDSVESALSGVSDTLVNITGQMLNR